ncbi:MAG: hypothetical protein KAX80_13245, partial [Planctomycetes bacterium]|nr:hypothetical protein [Planctomycetota bacterium]
MNLKDALPESLQEEVRARFGDQDDIQIALAADLSPGGSFGETWLVASAERVMVAPIGDSAPSQEGVSRDDDLFPPEVRTFPTKCFSKVRTEALVGCSRLVADVDSRQEVLLYYSGDLNDRFAEAAWALG